MLRCQAGQGGSGQESKASWTSAVRIHCLETHRCEENYKQTMEASTVQAFQFLCHFAKVGKQTQHISKITETAPLDDRCSQAKVRKADKRILIGAFTRLFVAAEKFRRLLL